MSAPIFRDPVQDGAADPTVIRNSATGEWWMFYTNRQALTDGPKFTWIHGSPIGVAVSDDDGASWRYRGTVAGLDDPADAGQRNTHWAPEVVEVDGLYHMFLSYISGVPDGFTSVDRTIVHFTSPDLERWTRIGPLQLSRRNVIDACVFPNPQGGWRLWYKDEAQGSSTWSATSPDMFEWTLEGLVLPGKPDAPPHEGPNVFALGGWYWLIVDEWRGLAVYRSDDTLHWTRQGLIGGEPGADPMDQRFVRHADVVVVGDHAALYYFTHCEWDELGDPAGPPDTQARRTAIHHGRLTVAGGELVFERDIPAATPLLRR